MTETPTSKTFQLGFDHDDHGRLKRIDYPGACGGKSFAVEYGYQDGVDKTGLLEKVSQVGADRVFWRVQARDARNDLRALELDVIGNVVGLSQTYERARPGRLTRLTTNIGALGGTVNSDVSYEYTPSGRLFKRVDALAGRTEKFTHDPLDRLDTWEASGSNTWSVTWKYDERGNLTGRDLIAPGGNESLAFTYGDTNRPQLVTGSSFGLYIHDWKGNRNSTPEWKITVCHCAFEATG